MPQDPPTPYDRPDPDVAEDYARSYHAYRLGETDVEPMSRDYPELTLTEITRIRHEVASEL